ncbi:hypothetical protein V5O48_002337 [Marasmius crinis-equi]|uniref:Fungal-type protein kinase domain-containing protein n=1 Tax=Marasmius crinis-equi TaxID=585013 RepID=A0ABR3FVT5_9AGAR
MKTLGATLPKHELSYFLNSVLHAVPEEVVNETYNALVADRTLVRGVNEDDGQEEYRWLWYEEDPSKMPGDEEIVFQPLEEISKAVIESAKTTWQDRPSEEPTVEFRCRPKHGSSSDTQNNGYRTDGDQELLESRYALFMNNGEVKDLYNSVMTIEVKKFNNVQLRNDNVRKVTGNSAHIMSSDPRRRSRLGVTIEDTRMRFWYFSRAFNFVSESFNFISNPKPFIQFLLATSFASQEELGYDPTVERVLVDGVWHYDYLIVDDEGNDHWYRTVKSLDTQRAARLPGPGTRVFLVVPLDSNRQPTESNKTYVLKDYWLPSDSKGEQQVQQEIINRAHAVRKGDIADIKKHFMTIRHDWVVLIEDRTDDTTLHLHGNMPPTSHWNHALQEDEITSLTAPKEAGVNANPTGSLQTRGEQVAYDIPSRTGGFPERILQPRTHRRLLFEEVGQPLDEIEDQRILAQCLVDAFQGLKVFYDAEYVHRDISVGNLLRCEVEKGRYICKISDLEYARPHLEPMNESSPLHDFKIGTPAFMAVEVKANAYIFGLRTADVGGFKERSKRSQGSCSVNAPFYHHYLHDLEAIWWIMVHSLFNTVPDGESLSPKQLQDRLSRRDRLFPASLASHEAVREHFMNLPPHRAPELASLPVPYQDLALAMVSAVDILLQHYTLAQQKGITEHDSFEGAHDRLLPFFEQARDLGVAKMTRLRDVHPTNEATNAALPNRLPSLDVEMGQFGEQHTHPRPLKRSVSLAGNDEISVGGAYQPARKIRRVGTTTKEPGTAPEAGPSARTQGARASKGKGKEKQTRRLEKESSSSSWKPSAPSSGATSPLEGARRKLRSSTRRDANKNA